MKALNSLYPMYIVNIETPDHTRGQSFYTLSEAESFARDFRVQIPHALITISRVEEEQTYADNGQAQWRAIPRMRVVEEIELPRMCQECRQEHITGSMFDIECPRTVLAAYGASSSPTPFKIDTSKAIEEARALRKEAELKRALEGALWQYEPTQIKDIPPNPAPAKKPDNTRIGIVAIDLDFDDDKD